MSNDELHMRRALELAAQAAEAGEVPVGAVLVMNGLVIGESANAQIAEHDPSAHAEVLALRAAGKATGNYRLPGSTLYVTLEPCAMCCGALVHARVETLVFATREPRFGAVASAQHLLDEGAFNHRVSWRECEDFALQSGALLRDFFRRRR